MQGFRRHRLTSIKDGVGSRVGVHAERRRVSCDRIRPAHVSFPLCASGFGRGGAVGPAAGQARGLPHHHWRRGCDHGWGGPGAQAGGARSRWAGHRRGRHARGDRAPVCGARDHRRDGAGRHARAHQYAYACADGALPGAGRRPGADGLAAEVYLSGGSQDRQSRVRPGRHPAGGARDDPVGDHGLRRHVLFRGRDRQGHQRSRHPRRPGADDHPVSGARREDTGRGDCARHDVHPAVVWRRADRTGNRAALDVYARHRYAQGNPGGGHA